MHNYILSAIAAPGSNALEDPFSTQFAKAFSKSEQVTWLAPNEAWEIALQLEDENHVRSALEGFRMALGGRPIDLNLVPAQDRRAKLLIADMDSTIIQQECIDEIADFVGKKAEVSAITERAMRGELEFESALRERVALLAELPEAMLQQVADERLKLTPGATTLVRTMNANGAMTALISGGFTFFTNHIAKITGFQTNQANTLLIENGALTGRVADPILGKQAKLDALIRLSPDEERRYTLAVGDGANDLAMIEAASLGVAFRAKPVVAAQAHAQIYHGDLTALLFLQGYRQDQFVDAA